MIAGTSVSVLAVGFVGVGVVADDGSARVLADGADDVSFSAVDGTDVHVS